MGALPEGVCDNYMAEMAAQLAVAASAGVRRVVIVFDATSPPEVLRRFVWSCRRKRQRFFRRDWLDTWWQQLQAFEVVVFVWQTSHVGAPVNEWADAAAAEAARAGLDEEAPRLLPAGYASLELEQVDGQLIRGGPRATAAAAAQREVERRLAVGSGSVQMVEECDLELPRLPERLVVVAEAVLCGRAQIGDARRCCGRVARRMAADMGCPFGCGCRFAWHDVAFTCGGAPLVRLREEWVAEAKEAARVLAARRPHSQMRQVLRRGVDGAGTELRHGAADEVELRRLVGGAVLNTGEREVDGCSRVRAAVGRMVRAGLELQAAGREATADFERRVREEARRQAKARAFAVRWREAARRGGPRRVAEMREVARAQGEAEADLAALEARAGVVGVQALERWEALGVACAGLRVQARQIRSISSACALREWRWLAGLRRWRWRAAFACVGAAGARTEPASKARVALAKVVHGGAGWAAVVGPAEGTLDVGGPFGPPLAAAVGPEGLDGRAVAARRRWRDGGGRRCLEWLRRWEIDEGREADSRGRWRVVRVLSVRRPARRYGLQLEVQLEWAGVDTASGEAWSVGWVPLAFCTPDVVKEARAMEAVAYPAPRRAEGSEGARKSPRLVAEAEAGTAESAREAAIRAAEGAVRVALATVDEALAAGEGRAEAASGEAAVGPAPGLASGSAPASGLAGVAAPLAAVDGLAAARGGGASGATPVAAAAAGPSEDGAGGEEVEDSLAALVSAVQKRKRGPDEAMLARVEAEVDRKMDNGVRINPVFRERARRAEEEEDEARRAVEEQEAAVPRCEAGHSMVRRGEGAAGLACDGCRRAIRRGAGWWCCEMCDYDRCDACCEM